jgi:glutamate racemase
VMAGIYSQEGGARLDQLVLACTHFPLLSQEIAAASPAGVTLVDSGAGIARRTAHLTHGQDWPERTEGRAVFTKDDENVDALKPALATYGLTHTDTL